MSIMENARQSLLERLEELNKCAKDFELLDQFQKEFDAQVDYFPGYFHFATVDVEDLEAAVSWFGETPRLVASSSPALAIKLEHINVHIHPEVYTEDVYRYMAKYGNWDTCYKLKNQREVCGDEARQAFEEGLI